MVRFFLGGREASEGSYGYPISVARTFEELFPWDPTVADHVSLGELADVVLRHACTVLQARGGAGKSYTARALMSHLQRSGHWVAFVPALELESNDDPSAWGLEKWTAVARAEASAAAATPGARGVVIIDGLNEVERERGDRILGKIGPVAAAYPQISFLVTDRLVRRGTTSPFWKYATLGRVPDNVIKDVAGVEPTEPLTIPFYLKRHSAGASAPRILRDSVLRFVPEEMLPALAKAAFMSYKTLRARLVDVALVSNAVGDERFQEMVAAGFLMPMGTSEAGSRSVEIARFEHHLLHDYLAGLHLASSSTYWTPRYFDVVTLRASSFDALGLALGAVPSASAVKFLQSVYDWNFYAAAYALEEGPDGLDGDAEALRWVLLGALGEKRFDTLSPTVLRVEDALRVQSRASAAKVLGARSRTEVAGVVAACAPLPGPGWYARWREMYLRDDGSAARELDLQALRSRNSVVGWGAANALRRCVLDRAQEELLRSMTLSSGCSELERWRVVHVLGAHRGRDNKEVIWRVLAEAPTNSWLAYGALRAYFEQLQAEPSQARVRSVDRFVRTLASTVSEPGSLRDETVRCLDVEPLPPDWHRDIEPLLELLWQTADHREAAELVALSERLRQRKSSALARTEGGDGVSA